MSTPTATALPEVRELPVLDRAVLKADAETWVNDRLAGLTGPARLEAAGRLLAATVAAADKAKPELDAVVHTLKTRYWLRRGANLAAAIGTNRSGVAVIMKRAVTNPPAPVEDAPIVLPRVARKVRTAEERVAAATRARDAAIPAAGLSRADAARLIGRDPSRVSRIVNRKGAA